jgi:hypothetical protein
MRIRVSDPAAAADLAEFLRGRIGAIVEATGRPSELEVSLLGSFGEDAMRRELEAATRRWSLLDRHPDAVVELD